jgi:hypothetical protein
MSRLLDSVAHKFYLAGFLLEPPMDLLSSRCDVFLVPIS